MRELGPGLDPEKSDTQSCIQRSHRQRQEREVGSRQRDQALVHRAGRGVAGARFLRGRERLLCWWRLLRYPFNYSDFLQYLRGWGFSHQRDWSPDREKILWKLVTCWFRAAFLTFSVRSPTQEGHSGVSCEDSWQMVSLKEHAVPGKQECFSCSLCHSFLSDKSAFCFVSQHSFKTLQICAINPFCSL